MKGWLHLWLNSCRSRPFSSSLNVETLSKPSSRCWTRASRAPLRKASRESCRPFSSTQTSTSARTSSSVLPAKGLRKRAATLGRLSPSACSKCAAPSPDLLPADEAELMGTVDLGSVASTSTCGGGILMDSRECQVGTRRSTRAIDLQKRRDNGLLHAQEKIGSYSTFNTWPRGRS